MDNLQKLMNLGRSDDVKDIMKGIRDSFVDDVRDGFVQKKTFSPSRVAWGSGGCPRNWYFLFTGVNSKETISSFAQDNMQNGTDSHARIQDRIMSGPLDVVCEENLEYNDPPINSYCDVIVEYQGKRVPVEIKTCNQVAFEYREGSGKAADYHILQLLVYMKILGSDLGFIMYENKNSYEKLLIPVHMDEVNTETIENAFAWMRETREAFDNSQLPKYFKGRRSNSKICKECPVKAVCDETGDGVVDIPLLKDYSRA